MPTSSARATIQAVVGQHREGGLGGRVVVRHQLGPGGPPPHPGSVLCHRQPQQQPPARAALYGVLEGRPGLLPDPPPRAPVRPEAPPAGPAR